MMQTFLELTNYNHFDDPLHYAFHPPSRPGLSMKREACFVCLI